MVVGWGVAQYPYLLGTHLSFAESFAQGAAPTPTLVALTVAAGAVALVVPSMALLFVLQQRGRLEV